MCARACRFCGAFELGHAVATIAVFVDGVNRRFLKNLFQSPSQETVVSSPWRVEYISSVFYLAACKV